MANVLGSLLVELGVNTAAFESGLSKATYQTKQFGRDVESSFRQAANSVSTVAATFGAFGPAGAAVSQVLLRMGEAIGSTTSKFASLNPVFGVFAGAAAGVAAGAAAATGALIGMAVETAETNDKLYHQSEIAGTSFEAFQKLAAGAKMYDISSESLSMSLTRMARQAMTAATSANYSATAFGRVGIQVKDSNGHLKDSAALFTEIMDKLSGMSNQTERNALAMQLLGRSAIQLIPALAAGSAQFKEFGDFAERVGAVMSTESGEGMHQFDVAMKEVGLVTDGARNRLTEGIIPALTQLVKAYADASHGGELFVEVGEKIGEMLRAIAAEASSDIAFFTQVADALAKINLTVNLPFAVGEEGPKKALAEFRKDWAELSAEQQKARDDSNKFIAGLNPPKAGFDIDKAVRDQSKSGKGPDLTPKGRGGEKAEADTVGEFIEKLSLAVNEQLLLAGAIDRSAGAMVLLKAQADSEKAIAEKRLELQNKLAALGKEKAGLIKDNEPEKAELLDKSIGEITGQLKKLKDSAELIGASFTSTAVLTSLNEISKSLGKTTESTVEQVREQELLSEAQVRSPAEQVFAKADEKVKSETESLKQAREEYELLSRTPGVKTDVIDTAKKKVDGLANSIYSLRSQFEAVAVLTALNEVNSTITKTTTSIDDQLSEQERLTTIQTRSTAEQVFAKADEKVKSETESLKQAREEYERLASVDTDWAALDAAKKSVDELAYKLGQLKGAFEAVDVLTAINRSGDAVTKVSDSVDEQLEAQQRVNAAKLQGPQALAKADVEVKLRPQTSALDDAKEEYAKLAQKSAESPGSVDPAALAAAKSGVDNLTEDVSRLREEYAKLAESDPDYWQKLDQQVAEAQIKFGSLTQAVHGLRTELELQGANTQMKVFDTLKTGIDGAEDSLAKFIVTGKGGFLAVLKEMEISLIRLGLQFLVAAAMKRIFGSAQTGGNTAGIVQSQIARQAAIGQAAAEAAAGAAAVAGPAAPAAAISAATAVEAALQGITALALGGDVTAGKSYLVGENHPEIFIAGSSGHVYPTADDVPGARASGGALSSPTRGADPRSSLSKADGQVSPADRGRDSSAAPVAGPVTIGINHSVSAIDADSFRDVLTEHSDVLASVITDHLRKLNTGML